MSKSPAVIDPGRVTAILVTEVPKVVAVAAVVEGNAIISLLH
jgi:hypothetical protein